MTNDGSKCSLDEAKVSQEARIAPIPALDYFLTETPMTHTHTLGTLVFLRDARASLGGRPVAH